jgi:hypothetical protein
VVPEPGTIGLVVLGLGLVMTRFRKGRSGAGSRASARLRRKR